MVPGIGAVDNHLRIAAAGNPKLLRKVLDVTEAECCCGPRPRCSLRCRSAAACRVRSHRRCGQVAGSDEVVLAVDAHLSVLGRGWNGMLERCERKSCSESSPPTTGAIAEGMLGSIAFAICIMAGNAIAADASSRRPLNLRCRAAEADMPRRDAARLRSTRKAVLSSQRGDAGQHPPREDAESTRHTAAGVSHWRYCGEAGSCCCFNQRDQVLLSALRRGLQHHHQALFKLCAAFDRDRRRTPREPGDDDCRAAKHGAGSRFPRCAMRPASANGSG